MAQGRSPAADAALEVLCRTYWISLYAFIRRGGSPVEEAKDLTQGFFARCLERRDFDAARQEKRRWAMAVLDQVLTRLGDEYRNSGCEPPYSPALHEFNPSIRSDPRPRSQRLILWSLGIMRDALFSS